MQTQGTIRFKLLLAAFKIRIGKYRKGSKTLMRLFAVVLLLVGAIAYGQVLKKEITSTRVDWGEQGRATVNYEGRLKVKSSNVGEHIMVYVDYWVIGLDQDGYAVCKSTKETIEFPKGETISEVFRGSLSTKVEDYEKVVRWAVRASDVYYLKPR